ncbi:unnamed protein product [Cylicocyclus nassatus]|uniref:DUF547 domain-containing protein n=1 Tax=Cylicocyclus nassatus TaxID=53992 RepID=A0AA36M8E8_CYLNA|nr:unnamed protein product [Cylicocyclus nassatus]
MLPVSDGASVPVPPEEDAFRYSPTWESDDEHTDFAYSDFYTNAYSDLYINGHFTDYNNGVLRSETIDEHEEMPAKVCDIETGKIMEDPEDDQDGTLNPGAPKGEYTVSEYNEVLANLMKQLFHDILTDDNRKILYYKLPENKHYKAYIEQVKNLRAVKVSEASPQERLAFFVNVFNMLSIHTTQINGAPRNIWERRKLMNCSYYQIEDHRYAPHSILNGILRSNRKGLAALWKPFGKKDQRLPLILPQCEPLVHFALNTGTRSTPPIRAYTCNFVYDELRDNACKALESNHFLRFDTKNRVIYLGKILKWYEIDMGRSTEMVLEYILDLMSRTNSKKKRMLEDWLCDGNVKVDYMTHDWMFNGQMSETEEK